MDKKTNKNVTTETTETTESMVATSDALGLEEMNADDLKALIDAARTLRKAKATPSIKINGYVASVQKHVTAALEAISKLSSAEGVGPEKWAAVQAHLSRLQLDIYRDEAARVTVRNRSRKPSLKVVEQKAQKTA